MSGQEERKFRSGPAYTVPDLSAAPSVRTQAYQPAAAVVQTSGRSLGNLGAALGGFFGGVAEAAQRVDQIDHQQNMVQIERENKALESQAIADKAAGRVNPAHMDRHAIVDLPDYDRLVKEQGVSDQWVWNDHRGQPGRVRAPAKRPGETRSLLSVANEIALPGRHRQVEYRDGDRRNLRFTNLRIVPRKGSKLSVTTEIDVHVPDNDRS